MGPPRYLKISKKAFQERIRKAEKLLSPCQLCPRKCGADRREDVPKKPGFCRVGRKARVSAYHAHFGEESVLVGPSADLTGSLQAGSGQAGGSGTIFFSSCNLACVFCQNAEISQGPLAVEIEKEELAKIMLDLQEMGCYNINFVSPTIWVPQILEALFLAVQKGLKIPLVYNSGGYDSVKTLKILDGVIDIYMPDVKYSDNKLGKKYSAAPNYWEVVKKALLEMQRQVGDLKVKNEVAVSGLLIRHLVLPNGLAGTKKVMEFVAKKISKNTSVNIMAQYYPTHRAYLFPELSRGITQKEFQEAKKQAQRTGLYNFL